MSDKQQAPSEWARERARDLIVYTLCDDPSQHVPCSVEQLCQAHKVIALALDEARADGMTEEAIGCVEHEIKANETLQWIADIIDRQHTVFEGQDIVQLIGNHPAVDALREKGDKP